MTVTLQDSVCPAPYNQFKTISCLYEHLLFADDQFIISDTEDNLQKQSIYYITYLKNIIWKLLQKGRKYLVSLEHIT